MAGQDFPFNVWISQSSHKLVLERTVEMVSELAVDGSEFQSVTEINEPLCRLLLTCPKGEPSSCCRCLYLVVLFEKVGNLLVAPVRRAIR